MERLQKKLKIKSIDQILRDEELLFLAVLLFFLIKEGAELPLILAIAYILLF